jgi:serine/threonine protein kinase
MVNSMDGDPDTSVLRDFVNGRLALDQLSLIQEYFKSNPDALERLASMEDDSFVKAFREGALVASNPPNRTGLHRPLTTSAPPRIKNYQFVYQIKDHDLVSTWTAQLSLASTTTTQSNRRNVIIKVFHRSDKSSREDLERFHREAETLRRLDHSNIVRYIDSDAVNHYSFLTMEYLEGIDLSRLVTSHGILPLGAVAAIAIQILQGLNYLYAQSVIHRDIKPSNIMLCSDGIVRLIDFGLARTLLGHSDKSLTRSEQFLGTIDYISPEQAIEPTAADIRSDLYSLGCTLFKLLTGNAPFSGRSFSNPLKKVVAHAMAQPPKLKTLRQDLPDAFCDCIEKLLAKNPADRYQTPAEAILAFAPWSEPNSIPAILDTNRPLIRKRHEDLWQISTVELNSGRSCNKPITKKSRIVLYTLSFAIATSAITPFFLPSSWFSTKSVTEGSKLQPADVRLLVLGPRPTNTPANSTPSQSNEIRLREGYYVGFERNLRNKLEQNAGIILSEDVFAYTTADNAPPGTLRRLGCLWTRMHQHELEKEGKFVYVEQPQISGYLILEVLSETEFKATCWRGSDFTLAEAIQNPDTGYFHSVIEVKWWSGDTLISGSAVQLHREIAQDWPNFLSKYSSRCVPDEKIRRP